MSSLAVLDGLLLLWSISGWTLLCEALECGDHKWIHDRVCIPSGYNKIKLPAEQVFVEIDFQDISLIAVNNEHETATFAMMIVLSWVEPELIIANVSSQEAGEEDTDWINLDLLAKEELWNPDLWIENLQSFQELNVLNPMRGLILDPQNKTIVFFSSILTTIRCPMTFADFPFDEQVNLPSSITTIPVG